MYGKVGSVENKIVNIKQLILALSFFFFGVGKSEIWVRSSGSTA